MIKKIELYEKNVSFSCNFYCNGKLIAHSKKNSKHIFYLDNCPAHIKIEIDPYKVKPLIRFNDVLVNYGLARITPWDHMLEFNIPENFFDFYFKNIIESKQQYLKITSEQVFKKIGYRQNYQYLIEEIEKVIK